MAIRNSRRKRVEFEVLEARETPSAGLGGGALAELATRHLVVHRGGTGGHARSHTGQLRGSGTATLVSETPTGNGGIAAVGSVTGQGSTIGAFTGTVQISLDPGFTTYTANAVFNGAGGSLDLTITKTAKKGSFTITGGTGTFAGATGHGTVTGTVSAATQSLSFNFQGTVSTH